MKKPMIPKRAESKRSKTSRERTEKAIRRLGTRLTSCIACGEDEPCCIELHHIAGHDHHEDTVMVCRNCHRKLTYLQMDHPISFGLDGQTESMGRYALGLSDALQMASGTLRCFGETLLDDEDKQE